MAEKKEKLAGVIVYGEDFDSLATEIGRRLARNPPIGYEVVKYDGPRDFPGIRRYADGDASGFNVSELLSDRYSRLCALDSRYFDEVVRPHLDRQLHDRTGGADVPTFLLHSAYQRPDTYDVHVSYTPERVHSQIGRFLTRFCNRKLTRTESEPGDVWHNMDLREPPRLRPHQSVEVEVSWGGLSREGVVVYMDADLRGMLAQWRVAGVRPSAST